MANNNYWQNAMFNLGMALGNNISKATDARNREGLDKASREFQGLVNSTNNNDKPLTTQQMVQNIADMGNIDVAKALQGGNTQQTNAPMSREDMLRANGSLINANGMPILSRAGNLIMSDKLMYEHYLNEGLPQIAQKYADHANWVRQNMEVPEAYLQNGANASYADAQDYLNGNKLYQGLANQALQNTPQNINPAQATPQVSQTAPNVNGNAYATPTASQAVAGNGYNFVAPSVSDITKGLLNGGYYGNMGNFLAGRK